jgi:hypothetical protein
VQDDKTSTTDVAGLGLASTPLRITRLIHHGMKACPQVPKLTTRGLGGKLH